MECLRDRYGQRFTHVERGVYGRQLADLVAMSKVVVCPDSPVTDRYWSNRVYVLGGYGAYLLHPDVPNLMLPIVEYERDTLTQAIDHSLQSKDRQYRQERILYHTKTNHLYRHRCEELLRIVKERLNVG